MDTKLTLYQVFAPEGRNSSPVGTPYSQHPSTDSKLLRYRTNEANSRARSGARSPELVPEAGAVRARRNRSIGRHRSPQRGSESTSAAPRD